MKEIYQQTVEEVLKQVGSKELGLTSEQARKSREKCGWNELAEGKKKNIVQIFFEQYKRFFGTYFNCISSHIRYAWRCRERRSNCDSDYG